MTVFNLKAGCIAVILFGCGIAVGPFSVAAAFGEEISEISARSLRAAFKSNNLRAEAQYSGRTFDVTGSFEGAENGMFNSGVVVTLAGENAFQNGFLGMLADGESQRAMRFDKGDAVRLRCTLKDTTLGTPTGEHCRFVTAAVPIEPPAAPRTPQMPISVPVQPTLAEVTQPPSPVVAPPVDPDYTAFSRGKRDRLGWENFFASATGDSRDGALWWSGQRSLKVPGSCSVGQTADFRQGCEQAQAVLGPTDVLRKTSPAYRSGWNSF